MLNKIKIKITLEFKEIKIIPITPNFLFMIHKINTETQFFFFGKQISVKNMVFVATVT